MTMAARRRVLIIKETDIVNVLTTLECRTNFSIKKITEYMLPKLKEAFYLHIENQSPHIIIRPVFEVFASELAAIKGVTKREAYFHSAEMTRFPKRVHKGINEIHYGISFKFENSKAVTLFIKKLITIIGGG
ncbi:conserved hypothetical protein [Psychromonas ingrahamii 37]|uniref:Uncharacterized protein n=1 Tax=Psychromonas ingrahamii (strain DSM 17664 / CCUG 51855 / 37) TaxID=357804 RepID=A1SXC7_PSYIN|nr:conserved hypothetical protein [Psychromonas ingrahamii 37]